NAKTANVTVSNLDDDSVGLNFGAANLTTSEAGTSQTFTVTLDSQPTANVTVTLTGLDATEGTLSASTVTFNAGNWSTAQTVTVTGVDDAIVDGNITYTLTGTTSGDAAYAGTNTQTANVTVTNQDDDTTGLNFGAATLTTSEAGTSQTFTVTL